jgi:hypothetical protein
MGFQINETDQMPLVKPMATVAFPRCFGRANSRSVPECESKGHRDLHDRILHQHRSDRSQGQTLLANPAIDAQHAFIANAATSLINAFDQIGAGVGKLRIKS